jgi:co-chaperonin GroES (HSP10)
MSLRPLADQVLVRRREVEEQHQGGIVIPDTAKDKPQAGEILAVGPGRMMDDGHCQPIAVAIGTPCYLGNTPEPRSSLTMKIFSSCANPTFSARLKANVSPFSKE